KAALAYIEKAWLEQVFAQLAELHIEVTRCWSAPATLPLNITEASTETVAVVQADSWTLQLYESVVMVRYGLSQAFSVDRPHVAAALQLLLTAQKRVDQLPSITLRATNKHDMRELIDSIPPALQG